MSAFESREVIKWERGETRAIEDDVIVETSLDLEINGREIITWLCSPGNWKNLAIGFLKSEGILDQYEQIENIDFERSQNCIEVTLTQDSGDLESYFNRKRALSSSGGRAGSVNEEVTKLELQEAEGNFPSVPNLAGMMKEMQNRANLFRRTGGAHTAALAENKNLLYLAEDVGRHNAIDKVIGKSIMNKDLLNNKVLFTSGRLSSEMVLKAIRSSIPILVSRSAPTTLGIRLARLGNLTLVGFTRRNRMSFYSGQERIIDT